MSTPTQVERPVQGAAVKVPAIGVSFWLAKLATTGGGEAASDWLAHRSYALAGVIGLGGLVVALALQLRSRRYVAWTYWLAVSAVAVFGTMGADVAHEILGLSYGATSVLYAAGVAAVFWLWRRVEGTVDVHSITTLRRELFYWAAVLATFALGTAVGDLSAMTLGLGFGPSAVLYTAMIAVPALAWWRFGLNAVVAFWSAYVLTRPLGASVADWFGKPADISGLGVGDGPVAVVAAVLLALAVAGSVRAPGLLQRRP